MSVKGLVLLALPHSTIMDNSPFVLHRVLGIQSPADVFKQRSF